MTPRATVEQAVEILKIHQLRRENAAIYQQIQNLRDEVVELKDKHVEHRDKAHEIGVDLQKLRLLVDGQCTSLDLTRSDVKTLLEAQATLKTSLLAVEDGSKEILNRTSSQQNHMEQKCDKLHKRFEELNETYRNDHQGIVEKVTELQNEIVHKAEAADLEQFRSRLADTVQVGHREAETGKTVNPSSEDTVLVYQSIEEPRNVSQTLPFAQHHGSEINDAQYSNGAVTEHDRVSDTASLAKSNFVQSLDSPDNPRASTIPDDIDLDANAYGISYAGHGMCLQSPQDSLVMLPQYQHNNTGSEISRSIDKQKPSEGLMSYLDRCWTETQQEPIVKEDIIVRQFVDGIVDEKVRSVWKQWLDATSWTWKSIGDVKLMLGMRASDTNGGTDGQTAAIDNDEAAETIPPTAAIVEQSTVNRPQSSATDPAPIVTNVVKHTQPNQPRRSQRLAAKNVKKDAHHAEKGNIQIKTSKPLQLEDRGGAKEIEAVKKQTKSNKEKRHLVTTVNINPRRWKRVLADIPTVNADARKDHAADASNNAQNVFGARTPQKGIVQESKYSEVYQFQDAPKGLPSSPLQEIAANNQTLPRNRSKLSRTRVVSHNLQPQLVPRKRKVPGHVRDSSAGEPRLPPPVRGNKKKKTALPSPPPIPILSTSTEEDRERFNRWHSP